MLSLTRKAQKQHAERVLRSLLRSPKTRPGLIAAVYSKAISRNFVYGFLTEQTRTGKVVVLKTGATDMYQNSACIVIEKPTESIYPTWLEPRSLPDAVRRRVYIDGLPVGGKR